MYYTVARRCYARRGLKVFPKERVIWEVKLKRYFLDCSLAMANPVFHFIDKFFSYPICWRFPANQLYYCR